MVSVKEWTKEIVGYWEQLPPEQRSDFIISFEIIRGFMGLEWLRKHFDPDSRHRGIFKLSYGTTEEEATRNYRSIDLAEVLLNLKDVEGFGQCIDRLRAADNPESGLAELHVGKMLYINQWPFRFVEPQNVRPASYDFEIQCNGYTVCADAKCKLEERELSSKTITKTLDNARTQLPPNGPGVFFIKFPQHWMNDSEWQRKTVQGALDFFAKGTTRVVSVVFYVEPLHYRDGWLGQGHVFNEVINFKHPLSKQFDWRLWERWKPPPVAPNTMPPFYARLTNFPTGLPGYEEN